jgi:hypothetical protein
VNRRFRKKIIYHTYHTYYKLNSRYVKQIVIFSRAKRPTAELRARCPAFRIGFRHESCRCFVNPGLRGASAVPKFSGPQTNLPATQASGAPAASPVSLSAPHNNYYPGVQRVRSEGAQMQRPQSPGKHVVDGVNGGPNLRPSHWLLTTDNCRFSAISYIARLGPELTVFHPRTTTNYAPQSGVEGPSRISVKCWYN